MKKVGSKIKMPSEEGKLVQLSGAKQEITKESDPELATISEVFFCWYDGLISSDNAFNTLISMCFDERTKIKIVLKRLQKRC
ncbi:hypothetical protein [Bhargavaea cecembensis]|uniref:hypothetical protein n=1 Tax=Bhargavaea cecembensis TaxID=394098 RepID=UPI0012E98BA7|nr:hypothetical protein [Bhargavaea cecembensis]